MVFAIMALWKVVLARGLPPPVLLSFPFSFARLACPALAISRPLRDKPIGWVTS